jgi:hypothetical protein
MNAPAPSADPIRDEVYRLANAVLSQEASDVELQRFEHLIARDPVARDCYLEYVCDAYNLHANLELSGQHVPCAPLAAISSEPDTEELHQTRIASSGPLLAVWHTTVNCFSSDWSVAYLIATAVLAIGALVGAVTYVSQPERIAVQPPVHKLPAAPSEATSIARITAMVDCVWERTGFGVQGSDAAILPSPACGRGAGGEGGLHSPAVTNSPLHLGDRLALRSGLLELTYDSGARVILQGPVAYEVDSPAGGYLSLGKLTARLDSHSEISKLKSQISNHKSEIINHKSFAVRTPTAVVTDLGTEFGVEVSKMGETTSHVFRGKVEVHAISSDRKPQGDGKVLHESQSIRVQNRGGDRILVVDASIESPAFVRNLSRPRIKTLDLVDVVSGGSGFSGMRNGAIDSTNGEVPVAPFPLKEKPYEGNPGYHRVKSLPFVDGVFIPGAGKVAVQLDSAGHTYDAFENSTNESASYVWAGGLVPTTRPPHFPTKLGDIDYLTPGHGLLYMHANKGITFDLQAIRNANPGCIIRRFLAVAANPCPIDSRDDGFADIWVFVDGRMRFRRGQVNARSDVFPIVIPIARKDRFLTLVSTDAGDGSVSHDWVTFGNPRLELTTFEAEPAPRTEAPKSTADGAEAATPNTRRPRNAK